MKLQRLPNRLTAIATTRLPTLQTKAVAERARARWADPEWKAQQAAKIKAGKAERLAREGTHHGNQRKATQLENSKGQ